MPLPVVSVVIPAFRAQATLPAALASIRTSGLDPEDLEVIVASDDGTDYRAVLPADPMLRYTPVGPRQTGAGPARNRALQQVRGAFIAFLDADDTWAPGYLAALLPLARRFGAAFGSTAVLSDGMEILRLPHAAAEHAAGEPPASALLTLEDMGRTGASYHPLLIRQQARPFTAHLCQDIRHSAELLARLGGSAPLGPTLYQLRMNGVSTTAGADFSRRAEAAYHAHLQEIAGGQGDIPDPLRLRVAQVFRDKAALNAAYMADRTPGQSFYAYVAARQRQGTLT